MTPKYFVIATTKGVINERNNVNTTAIRDWICGIRKREFHSVN
jgi:hypothetical protein